MILWAADLTCNSLTLQHLLCVCVCVWDGKRKGRRICPKLQEIRAFENFYRNILLLGWWVMCVKLLVKPRQLFLKMVCTEYTDIQI